MAVKDKGLVLFLLVAGCQIQTKEARAFEYYKQGLVCIDQGNYTKAIELFSVAIEHNPYISDAYYKRGNCYIKTIRSEVSLQKASELTNLAINDYASALRILPVFYDAYYNRAMAYASLARYKDAVKDLIDCARINENFADAYRELGDLYERKFTGETYRAIEYYRRYLDKVPTDRLIREKLQRLEKAGLKSEETIKVEKKIQEEIDAQKLFEIAVEMSKNNKRNEALDILKEILKKYPTTKVAQEKVIPLLVDSQKQ